MEKQTSLYTASIMLVDDNAANLNYLLHVLSDQPYQLRAFADGELALASAIQQAPDLILLDINMPGLNGFEVCARLKTDPTLGTVPIIFISARSNTEDKLHAFEVGGVDYITKPFEPEEIKVRIKTHLRLAKTELLENEILRRINIENQYYAQLDHLSHAIIHINSKGHIVYANPMAEDYFGYTSSELLGQPIEILISEEHRGTHITYRRNYFTSPATQQMSSTNDTFAKKKNGELFPVEIRLNSLYSDKGMLVSAEIRDITEQHRMQQELQTQRQYMDDAFGKTTDGFIITDALGTILLSNPAVTSMLACHLQDIQGKSDQHLFASHDDYRKISLLKKIDSTESRTNPCIVKIQRKDGSQFPAEITLVPIKDCKTERNGYFIIMRDISERVLMEQEHKSLHKQLMQSQKMEALGQLTGGIAHDFNNILASMMGFTELGLYLLSDETDLKNSKDHQRLTDYLGEVHRAGERASKLIKQMLAFSRAGNNETLKPFDLNILIKDTIKMLRPVFPSSITIDADIEHMMPMVLADPVQLHQALMNIFINARDAMDGNGHISIRLESIPINNAICTSCLHDITGDFVSLTIQDTGTGIDDKTIEHLFEPFFSTKDIGKGTGMGLAMVHGIMHHHQGHIIVQSKTGTGSSFQLLFPLNTDNSGKPVQTATAEELQQEPA